MFFDQRNSRTSGSGGLYLWGDELETFGPEYGMRVMCLNLEHRWVRFASAMSRLCRLRYCEELLVEVLLGILQ